MFHILLAQEIKKKKKKKKIRRNLVRNFRKKIENGENGKQK